MTNINASVSVLSITSLKPVMGVLLNYIYIHITAASKRVFAFTKVTVPNFLKDVYDFVIIIVCDPPNLLMFRSSDGFHLLVPLRILETEYLP